MSRQVFLRYLHTGHVAERAFGCTDDCVTTFVGRPCRKVPAAAQGKHPPKKKQSDLSAPNSRYCEGRAARMLTLSLSETFPIKGRYRSNGCRIQNELLRGAGWGSRHYQGAFKRRRRGQWLAVP